ncbi:MAG TPA: hemolysin family protein [Gemmatimonadaceae bacterium]|nr:hemolysin family protein [Gemmatimonadaceae bacterium]
MRIALEIVAILALLVANGVLAMSEIAVVTARRGRLARRAEQGDPRAAAAAALKEQPTEFLAAVQIGISLVGILAGAFGGARLAARLAAPLARVGWLAPYADGFALALVVGVITYLSLVIGELVPKRIALADPERVAGRVARPMQQLSRVARPLVAVLSASTDAVARLFGIRGEHGTDVTEEDIRALIAQGARAGVVHETEEDILERVFYLGDRQVGAVMTPRPDIDWVGAGAAATEIRDVLARSRHSHLLVCDGGVDDVRGVVRASDLLLQCLGGGPVALAPLLREPLFVPATMPLLQLLQRFRQSEVHLAVALGEFGSVLGVVSLNDILGDLVADVPGLAGPRASDLVRRDDGSWLVDGTVPLETLEDVLGRKVLPLGAERGSRTVGGLLLERLGRVPAEGESVTVGGFRFEVMDMDGRRVDRVLVQLAGEAPAVPTSAARPASPAE